MAVEMILGYIFLASATAILGYCAVEDFNSKVVSDKKIWLLIVVCSLSASLFAKTWYVAVGISIAYGLVIMWRGQQLFNEKFYGGADVKIAAALSPAFVVMGGYGVLYILWFLVLNPLFARMKWTKKDNVATEPYTTKYPFVPVMFIVFLLMLAGFILTVI